MGEEGQETPVHTKAAGAERDLSRTCVGQEMQLPSGVQHGKVHLAAHLSPEQQDHCCREKARRAWEEQPGQSANREGGKPRRAHSYCNTLPESEISLPLGSELINVTQRCTDCRAEKRTKGAL